MRRPADAAWTGTGIASCALEAAVAVRCIDIVMLGIAAVAVVCLHRRAGIAARSLAWWFGSLAVFATVVATFDAVFYGGPFKTGYGAGEITFSTSAIVPNLNPERFFLSTHLLVASMPALVVGLTALVWMGARNWCTTGITPPICKPRPGPWPCATPSSGSSWPPGGWGSGGSTRPTPGRPRWVPARPAEWWAGVSGALHAVGGGGGGGAIHVIRFYLPAIGLIALLSAWPLAQLPRWFPLGGARRARRPGPVVVRGPSTAAGAAGGPAGGFPGGNSAGVPATGRAGPGGSPLPGTNLPEAADPLGRRRVRTIGRWRASGRWSPLTRTPSA